jgi:hypothetical protein
MKSRREHSGYYQVTFDNGATFIVLRNPEISGPDKWMYYAEQDRWHMSDPMWSKADCMACLAQYEKEQAEKRLLKNNLK